ncbi:glycosyltransferase family 4 protein [Marinospirillum alkaliphilum]|uniref:Glycosyltransferase involved in cell wall bisynthesis n=1 Tax=Marinospirillum alkaliphilum DSM 21637 TaxID=1122209 RepID=A0A1K1WRG0_9GAMM|nr:glycosyltransferase family 4 protein [Marinospirillum alkaliphilum]SFX39699.1 Glycosyltransferase involved in cell wall bisynthesis [Marinospirillum alkaliphilum DSM 21637]
MRLIQVCLSDRYDESTRQVETLVHTLAEKKIRQLLVCRRNSELHNKLRHLRNLPIVTSSSRFMGHFSVPRTGLVHAHDPQAIQWARWQQRLRGTPWLLSWRDPDADSISQLSQSSLKKAQAMLVTSLATEQAMRERASCPVKRIPDVIQSLSTNPIKMTELRSHYRGRFVIGHAGRLDSEGNQQMLVAAAEILHKELPGAIFVVLGEGPLLDKLSKKTAGLDNIDFVGEPEHPGDYYSVMNIFVDPANHATTFAPLLQAMNFHIPVIASKVSGFAELISHRSNGLLFRKGDVKSLIEMIRVLYDSVPMRTRITRDAQSLVKESAPEQVALKHLAVYQAIIRSLKGESGS